MFNNIGKKIKGLAKFICWLGIIASVLLGILVIFGGANLVNSFNSYYRGSYYAYYDNGVSTASVISGLVVMVIGGVFSWLGSLALYGFGQLVDNSDAIRDELANK